MTTPTSGGPHEKQDSPLTPLKYPQFIHPPPLFVPLVQALNYLPLDLTHFNPFSKIELFKMQIMSLLLKLSQWFFVE